MMQYVNTDLMKHLPDQYLPPSDHQRAITRMRRAERRKKLLGLMNKLRSSTQLHGRRIVQMIANGRKSLTPPNWHFGQ